MEEPIKIIPYDEKYALATVQMWRASMERALGIIDTHTWEEQLGYLAHLAEQYNVFLAIDAPADKPVGLMVVGGTELDQLYIHVEYQGRGIGTQLLDLAKEQSPGTLQLYTFEVNAGAQAFYEKHGFQIIGRGVEQESGMADIRYEWIRTYAP